MTYTDLTATTKFSELAGILNGIKTRRESLEFVRHHDATNSTNRGSNGNFFQEGFATGEQCHCKWLMCDRLDAAVNATLSLHFAMQGAGTAGDEASFDVGYVVIDVTQNDGTELTTQTPTVVSGSDVDVAAFSAGGHFVETYTIPAAALTAGGLIGFEIERVAPGGTDHSSDIGLIGVEIQYTIER